MHILHTEHRAEPNVAVRTSSSAVEIEQPWIGAAEEVTSTKEERITQARKDRVVVVPAVLSVSTT